MNMSRFGAVRIGSARPTIRGTRVQRTLAAMALGSAATSVTGDVLDFESLPYPTTWIASNGGYVYDPLSSYMGFRFSSENFMPPGPFSQFANVWSDYALTATPVYTNGYPFGINGGRALGTPMYDMYLPNTFAIEREDGGQWVFSGAQFSPVTFANSGISTFRIVGWRDGAMVYDISTVLIPMQQLFFGGAVNAIAVDKVVMTYRRLYENGGETSRWFTMDDMHYQLVPAPGALVLLGMGGLLRQRRRD